MQSDPDIIMVQQYDQLTEAQVREVFDQNVDGVLRPDGACLQECKSGLHEQDHGAHEHEEEVVDVLGDGCERIILGAGSGIAAVLIGVAGIVTLCLHLAERSGDKCEGRWS